MLAALFILAIGAVSLSTEEEIDCLQGNDRCQNANSFISDGYTTKCCKNGYSLSSVSNSLINGVVVNYCKCTRYIGGNIFGNIIGRPMTKEEREKFEQTMRNASQTLNNEMSQLQKTLNESLKNVHTHLGDGFLNGLNQNLNQLGNVIDSALQAANFNLAGARNIAQAVQPRLPWQGSTWNLQQRRLQQLQRRLNGVGMTFWDRLSRNPFMSQMMNPGWWFGNVWNGLYGNRNQTA